MAENTVQQSTTEHLNLKVKSQVVMALTKDGEEVFFKIKNTTQLKKLMDAYCQKQSVQLPIIVAISQQCSIPI